VRLRFLLPQLLISVGIAIASGHYWLLLMPLITGVLLLGQARKFSDAEPIRQLGGRIWLGGRRLSRIPWLWPPEVRQRVLLGTLESEDDQLSDHYRNALLLTHESPLLGVEASGTPVRLTELESLGHLLIIGATGSGKTQLLRNLLSQLRGDCWCADYKGGSGLMNSRDFARSTTNLDIDRDQFWHAASADLVARELNQRNRLAATPLFLVIDELAAALSEPLALRTIDAIARKGRGLGLHLLAASQNLAGIPRSIWTNLHSRVVLAPADITDALQLGLDAGSVKALRPHQGVLRTPYQTIAFWYPPLPSPTTIRAKTNPMAIGRNPLLDFSGEARKHL